MATPNLSNLTRDFFSALIGAFNPDFRSLNTWASNVQGQGVGVPPGPPPNPHAGMVALGAGQRTPLSQQTLGQTALANDLAVMSTPQSQAAGSPFAPGRAVTRPDLVPQIQGMNQVQRPTMRAGQPQYDVYQTGVSLAGRPIYNRAPQAGENMLRFNDFQLGEYRPDAPGPFKFGPPPNATITPFTPPNPNRRGSGTQAMSRPGNDRVVK